LAKLPTGAASLEKSQMPPVILQDSYYAHADYIGSNKFEGGEMSDKGECGCHCHIGEGGFIVLEYCPKHKAAPDMYEALGHLINSYEFHCPEAKTESQAIKTAKATLAKAEGKEK